MSSTVRRIVALLITAGLLLTACAPDEPDEEAEPDDEIRLVVFGPSQFDTIPGNTPESIHQDVHQFLTEGFQEEYPEVEEIVFDAQGEIADGVARTTNTQLAGEQMDIIVCHPINVHTAFQETGTILPVDDLVPEVEDRLVDGAIETFTIDDQVWGIPLAEVAVTSFFYNASMFDDLGIEPPETYEDFRQIGPTISDAGVEPVAHQGRNPWMWPIYYMSTLQQTTAESANEKTESNLRGETKFTDDEDVLALELIQRWVEDDLMSRGSLDLDEEALKSMFVSEETATYFGATWDLPDLRETVGFELGIFKYPEYEDLPGEPRAFGSLEHGLCVSETTEHREYAEAFIEFATRPENAEYVLQQLEPVGTSHEVYEGADDPISEKVRDEYLPPLLYLDWLWPRELTDVIQREIQEVVGGKDPAAAAEAIQGQYDRMVEEGYEYED